MVTREDTLQAAAAAAAMYRAATSRSSADVSCSALPLAVCWKTQDREGVPGTSLSHQLPLLGAHSRPGLLVLAILPAQALLSFLLGDPGL